MKFIETLRSMNAKKAIIELEKGEISLDLYVDGKPVDFSSPLFDEARQFVGLDREAWYTEVVEIDLVTSQVTSTISTMVRREVTNHYTIEDYLA